MSRINTNVPSMIAQRVLGTQNSRLNLSLQRLSTGLRINSGKDDPAGLIASELLRVEAVAIGAALTNISRANNVIAVAESALGEINRLLLDLEGLIDRSANEGAISTDERDANQLEIDAILDSINRIATSTEFQGKKLLNGELDYQTSGVSSANFTGVSISSARLAQGQTRSVVVEVTTSAQLARVNYSGATVGSTAVTIEIAGRFGTETLSFAANTTIANVVSAVNQTSSLTGVTASAAGTTLVFNSTGFGKAEFVSVKTLTGTFAVTGGDAGDGKDFGQDVGARINGITAATAGLVAKMRSGTLSVDLDLSSTFAQTLGASTFVILGGGADFQISPKVTIAGKESIGIASFSIGSLGSGVDGFLSALKSGGTNDLLSGNYSVAQRIVRAAQRDVSNLRGRLGAFQKDTLETTANALRITLENTVAAESSIRDTDFAAETSNLTRQQILVQSATNVLRLANAAPQQVLALLQ